MALTRYRLGDLIEQRDERNSDNELCLDDVRGISIAKAFIDTKANMEGVSLTPYKKVAPQDYAYVTVTSRNGNKITLAYNDSIETFLVSSSYLVFYVTRPAILDSKYLFMYFKRSEFDRFSRFNSWGSARETFSWEDMCDIEIDLPPIEIQRKYVAIYEAMCENQRCYEAGLEDLKLVCQIAIENLKDKCAEKPIGDYIKKVNEKNTDGKINLEQGINIKKEFITPQRRNSNLLGRKIVRRGQFAYCTQLNNENVAIAYREGEDCVVSSVYDVFEIKNPSELNPYYLMLWLIRPEFGRFVYWASEGSAYEFLNYDNLANYKIPIPSQTIQKSIANIFSAYNQRKEINEKLKAQIRDLCPILIKGSLEEAARAEDDV